MLNFLIHLFFSFLLFLDFTPWMSHSILKPTVNATNAQGVKEGKWKYYGKDLPSYQYPEKSLVLEGTYNNGRKDGEWTQYYKDGRTPKLVAEYKDNRPHGPFHKYNSKGVLVESGTFEDGKYSGKVTKFYNNGVERYSGEFYNGKENGEILLFDKKGNPELAYSSYDGVVTNKTEVVENKKAKHKNKLNIVAGEMITDKNETQTVNFHPNKNFNPNGYNRIYNQKGDILQDGSFKNGKLQDGKLYQYDADGILFKVKIFKNGSYISDGQI